MDEEYAIAFARLIAEPLGMLVGKPLRPVVYYAPGGIAVGRPETVESLFGKTRGATVVDITT